MFIILRIWHNYVYANRMGNGDEASGDGYNLRGRGVIQVTGRDNYTQLQCWHVKDFPNESEDFLKDPDLLSGENHYQAVIESAFIYWYNVGNVHPLAISETATVKKVTHKVNNGYNGYKQRLAAFNRLARYFGIAEASE